MQRPSIHKLRNQLCEMDSYLDHTRCHSRCSFCGKYKNSCRGKLPKCVCKLFSESIKCLHDVEKEERLLRQQKTTFLEEINYKTQEFYYTSLPNKCSTYIAISLIIFIIVLSIFLVLQYEKRDVGCDGIKNLIQHFPSQEIETWANIKSVVNKTKPSVRSLVLLHQDRGSTAHCLAEQIVRIFKEGNETEAVYFEIPKNISDDYGELLEYYVTMVKKNRILVVRNVNNLEGDTPKIFHSLCDEISSDIKPSLFIFTMRITADQVDINPITTASKVLKAAWSHLKSEDLYPLLSRIIRNVVKVMPEGKLNCTTT